MLGGGSSINKRIQMLMLMFILSAIVVSAFNFPCAKAVDQDSWTSLTPMPTARGGLGVAVVDDKIYAIGGLSGDAPLGNNEQYDPVANAWTAESPMPTARSGFAIAVYNNTIYCIGGTINHAYVGNAEVYDPATNTWETKASMPTPRADLIANVVGDKIYLIGGKKYTNNSPYFGETGINEVYDPVNNTWTTKAPMPTPVYGYASAVVDGKIHFIGGSYAPQYEGSSAFVSCQQVYDPQTDNWSLAASFPDFASYGAAAVTQNYMAPANLYFLGGYYLNQISGKTLIYSPINGSWTSGVSMPTPRAYLGVAVINDVLYAIGGFDGNNWLNVNEKYNPVGYATVPPQVQITSPENKTYKDVTLIFTINRGAEWIGYSLDNRANITINGETQLVNLTQGSHNIVIYANDSSGNMGSSNTVSFFVDTTPPKIVIASPQNQSYGGTDIQLDFTVNKKVTKIEYSLDGSKNETIVGNVTLSALTNGSHKLTIYTVDEIGNLGSQTVYFTIAPFPLMAVAAAAASVTIASAAGYLLYKRKKPGKDERCNYLILIITNSYQKMFLKRENLSK